MSGFSYAARRRTDAAVLALRCFVAAEVLLGLGEHHVLAQLGAVLLKRQLFRRVHGVFVRVVNALAGLLAHQANQFAFVVLFCHR